MVEKEQIDGDKVIGRETTQKTVEIIMRQTWAKAVAFVMEKCMLEMEFEPRYSGRIKLIEFD